MVLLKQRFALARVNVTDPAIVTVRRIGRQCRGETQSALLAYERWGSVSFALLAFI